MRTLMRSASIETNEDAKNFTLHLMEIDDSGYPVFMKKIIFDTYIEAHQFSHKYLNNIDE